MTKTLLHRYILATSLFLLSTFSPCAGTTQKSLQDIKGEELLEAIQNIDQHTKQANAKAIAIDLLNRRPTPNLEIHDDLGDTSLHWAANRGYTDIVQLLLKKGANPSPQDNDKDTPLHDAVNNGHQDVVKLLLQYKADTSIPNDSNETPLDLANELSDDEEGKQAIIQLLQANNLNINASSNQTRGTTQKSPQDIDGQKLLQAIQDIDEDENGRKAKATAIALLNKRPTPNLEIKDNKYGSRSLHWAANRGYTDIVQLLLQKGANPSPKDDESDATPLHDAVNNGHQDIVKLLLQYKADTRIPNKEGKTPLDLANELSDHKEGKQAIIQLLQANNQGNPNGNPSPQPIQIQTNTNTHLDQGSNPSLKPNNSSPRPIQTSTNHVLTKDNVIIGIAILIIVAGVGYLLWPEPQDDDTPRHTKSNAQQEQSTKTTRTATAK